MAKKEILVCYDIDIDAVAGWLGSYNGEDSPDDISRGMTCLPNTALKLPGLLPVIPLKRSRNR